MKKVLITGSNGMLGKDVVNVLKKEPDYEIYGVNRSQDSQLLKDRSKILDITDQIKLKYLLKEIDPDIIIHCAASVNLNRCEEDKEYARCINVEATKNLVQFSSPKVKFFYISTDSVFDGISGGYIEDSKMNPLNYYAKTKKLAENIVRQNNNKSIIIRTNIYGFHTSPGVSLFEWAIEELKKNNKISGFSDVWFNPVYTKQLADIIIELLKVNFAGTIHIGCEKGISKYLFLKKIASTFGFNTELINSISIDDIISNVKRSKNTVLKTAKLKSILGHSILIDDGINQLYRDYNNIFQQRKMYE